MRREELYLRDILEAAGRIADYITGIDRSAFVSDRLIHDAVARNLTIIGEAASSISKATKERYSDLPWSDIVAFRNILVHVYFGTDWDIVWGAASHDAPHLGERVRQILAAEYPDHPTVP